MRWEDELGDKRTPSFRTDTATPDSISFVALRLRAKIAQTGNPTNVPLDDQGDSDSNPAC
jgi:hypothetical protein